MRNTNKSIDESIVELQEIVNLSNKYNKEVVVYLSMGFGNPYGDTWNYEIVQKYIDVLYNMNIKTISISDTVGSASKKDISYVFSKVLVDYK